jgi:recombination protein RecT
MTSPVNNLRDLLEKSKGQIATALPKHMTPERMIRVALTTFQRTPDLAECSPLSIVGCVVQASELGLELSGPLGQAYMVPYKNKNTGNKEAQFQVGYKGLMDLAYRSGKVTTFNAHCVYANDEFYFQYGTDPKLLHKPTLDDPGDVIAIYAVLNMVGGGFDFEVMSAKQINSHRDKYSKAKNSSFSGWQTAWEEMAKKTVIRRLAKRAPVSIEVRAAASADEYAESQVQQIHVDMPGGSPLPLGRQSLRGESLPAPATNGDIEETGGNSGAPDNEPNDRPRGASEAPAQATTAEIVSQFDPEEEFQHWSGVIAEAGDLAEWDEVHTSVKSACLQLPEGIGVKLRDLLRKKRSALQTVKAPKSTPAKTEQPELGDESF